MNQTNEQLLRMYEYRESCVGYLLSKTNCDRDQAEHLFLEAILDLHDKQVDHEPIKNMKSFLIRTSYNHWKRMYYSTRKQTEAIPMIVRCFYQYLPHRMLEADEEASQVEENLGQIETAINRMGERCRLIIHYFYIEDKNMADIASIFKFNSSTVATTVKYRCMKKLREIINQMSKKK